MEAAFAKSGSVIRNRKRISCQKVEKGRCSIEMWGFVLLTELVVSAGIMKGK